MPHAADHFLWGLAVAAVAAAAAALVRNHAIRRRLRLSFLSLGVFAGLHAAIVWMPAAAALGQAPAVEHLLLALAVINTAVALAVNPWFHDRLPERAPAIVQDTIVVAAFVLVATFVFDERLLTTSAIAAAVVGFALQETLGNAFAGLAIQIDKPFRVGHWVTVGEFEGEVVEVTWRATKLRTKAGNLVILPNNLVASQAVNNYSEPAAPTRLFVEVGAGYQVPPNDVRAAIENAMRRVPRVLPSPEAEVLLWDFGDSALQFRAYFWVLDYSREEQTRDEVRRAIYYEFHRRGIEIPWPIQIEYQRVEQPPDLAARERGFVDAIGRASVLASLEPDARRALAAGAAERLYADGEVIVREGEPGASMFIVRGGRVAVTVGEPPREVAVTEAGGYFGEMSLLTGEPRSATVIARGDARVLELGADAFRDYVASRPDVLEVLAGAAAARRHELDARRAEPGAPAPAAAGSLLARMRRFFGLG